MTEHSRWNELNVLVDPTARPIIAHRGASARAPENTIEAFSRALEDGADAIELDVRLARDGSVVVIHDPDIDRTTSGTGAVASMSALELRAVDAGARFSSDEGRTYPYRERSVRIPSLDDVLAAFPHTAMLIEIKEAHATRAVAALVRRHGAMDRVVLASELDEAMQIARAESFMTSASRPDALRLLRQACLGVVPDALPYQALSIPWRVGMLRVPMSLMCRSARRARVPTHAWTVNSEAVAKRLWRVGVNGILADDPGSFVRLRASS